MDVIKLGLEDCSEDATWTNLCYPHIFSQGVEQTLMEDTVILIVSRLLVRILDHAHVPVSADRKSVV